MHQAIRNYIGAGYPALYIVSHEEQRVESELRAVAQAVNYDVFHWSCTSGLVDPHGTKLSEETRDPIVMLQHFMELESDHTIREKDNYSARVVVMLRDFHAFLDPQVLVGNPVLVRALRDALLVAKATNRVLVLCGCRMNLPAELEKEIQIVEFKLPDREMLGMVLDNMAKCAGIDVGNNGKRESILDAGAGLTTIEFEAAIALSVVEAKDIAPDIIAREKALTVKKNGLLEIIETKEDINSMGGCESAKDWTSKRRHAFGKKAKQFGLPVPKGILLVGVPGCGKTYFSKIIAKVFGVPLIKLDAGRIYAKHVGESEGNVRAAIETAEAIAPCVLLIDEIEKGMSGSKSSGETDGGTSARVFGTFLQWMNDKTAPVFVVATANQIAQLPPEFLRKGRFDELFFVDLPQPEERVDILKIHLRKRDRNPDEFNLESLAGATDGFSGAELEAIIVEGLYAAFDADVPLNDSHLAEAIKNTVPLSRTMAADVQGIREWANGRARRATPVKTVDIKPTSRKLA